MELVKAWRETRKIKCPICGQSYRIHKLDNGLWNTTEVPNKIWMPSVFQDGKGHNYKFGVCLACYRIYEKYNVKRVIGTQPVLLRFNYQCYFIGSYFNYTVNESVSNPSTGFITWNWDKEKGSVEKIVNF